MTLLKKVMIGCLCLGLTAPTLMSAQESSEEMSRKVKELETLVLELKAEMAAMKATTLQAAPAAQTAVAVSNTATPGQIRTPQGKILIASLGAPTSLPPAEATPFPQDAAKAPEKVTLGSLLGPTSLSGYVDGYYSFNFNNPTSLGNNLHSFDRFGNQFELGLVQLQIDKVPSEESRTGYRVSLGFGQAMTGLSELDPGETKTIPPVGGLGSNGLGFGKIGFAQYLMEGYFSYMPAKNLQVDVGKFVTPVGVELVPAKDNWNYTRGLIYSWTNPYFHYGMRAKYTFNSKAALSGFLVNGWNNIFDSTSGKTYAAQLSLTPSAKFGITQTYMGGPEVANSVWRHLSDTIITINPTSKLSLIFNAIYWKDKYGTTADPWVFGNADYLKYTINDKYALAARYEYLDDKYGYATGLVQPLVATIGAAPKGARVHEVTATFERTIASKIITRWEFRRDLSNVAFFDKGGKFVDRQNTFTIGLMYKFDTLGK